MERPDFYAPPAAPNLSEAAPSREVAARVEYAQFFIRGVARLLDMVVDLGFSLAAGAASGILIAAIAPPGHIDAAWIAHMKQPQIINFIGGTVMSLAYHVFAEWLGGATLGKLLVGLRVRSTHLGPCTFHGALMRNLGYFVDALFFGAVAYGSMQQSQQQQRLGDKWGNTVVIKARSLEDGPTAGQPNPRQCGGSRGRDRLRRRLHAPSRALGRHRKPSAHHRRRHRPAGDARVRGARWVYRRDRRRARPSPSRQFTGCWSSRLPPGNRYFPCRPRLPH